MQNNISIFKHENFGDTRFVTEGDSFVVVAKDVVEKVGNTWAGIASVRHVPEQWRGVNSVLTPSGTQDMLCLSEQGLYFYLGRCDKPVALQYQMWIAGEVVPSIRKHGGYLVSKPDDTPDTVIARALLLAGDKIRGLEDKIAQDAPKVRLADDFLTIYSEIESAESFDKCVTVGVLAKKLKQEGLPFGQNRLFKYLREQGVLYSREGENFNTPTQQYMERGWFKVKATRMILADGVKWEKTTMVTPKGVKEISARIHELFNQEVFA